MDDDIITIGYEDRDYIIGDDYDEYLAAKDLERSDD